MADTKVSALTAVATPAVSDEFPVNQGGTSKKVTLGQILNQRVYDAKAYGAVVDGSTNDAAAIQSAMDAAGAAGGGVVVIPRGTANLGTTSLEFKHSNVRVRGAGKGATTLLYTGSSGAFRNSDEATPSIRSYCGVSDMTINFSGAGSGASALRLWAMRQFVGERLYLFSSSTGGGSTWYGIHLIGETTAETYFGQFTDVDIALIGAAGTQWCVYMGGDGWVNRHTFTGGVWEGNNANAVGIQPTSLTSDTNLFLGVSFQTHGATIIQLGGAGADANDNIFMGCRFEVGVGSSTITLSTASGVAQRNEFIACYTSNVSFSDPLEQHGNKILSQSDWKLDLYNGSDPSRSIWLRGYQSGLTIGRSDGASGVLTLGESNYASSPAANFMQVRGADDAGLTRLRARDSGGIDWDIAPLFKVVKLGSDHSVSSATATEVTGLQVTLPAGTFIATYYLVCQSTATGTGLGFAINYTGTVTRMSAVMRYPSTGAAAATGVAEDAVNTLTGTLLEASAARTEATTAANLGPFTGVAAANQDILVVIELLIEVSNGGDLELWHASEGAVATTVESGSSLVLVRTA